MRLSAFTLEKIKHTWNFQKAPTDETLQMSNKVLSNWSKLLITNTVKSLIEDAP